MGRVGVDLLVQRRIRCQCMYGWFCEKVRRSMGYVLVSR